MTIMNHRVALIISVLVLSIAFTIFIGLYMARPWDDNYAYKNISGYLSLSMFMLWAISPYIGLSFLTLIFKKHRLAIIGFMIGTFIISLFGVYGLIDTSFLHIDAQGGLIFIFLPIYQWFATIILVGICIFLKRYNHANA